MPLLQGLPLHRKPPFSQGLAALAAMELGLAPLLTRGIPCYKGRPCRKGYMQASQSIPFLVWSKCSMPWYLGRTLVVSLVHLVPKLQEWHRRLIFPTKSSPFQQALNLGFWCLLSRHMCHIMWCFATMWNKYLSFSAAHSPSSLYSCTKSLCSFIVLFHVYQVTDRLQARQHVVVYMPPLPKHLSEDC